MTRVLHLSRRPLNGHPGFLAELQRRRGWDAKVCCVFPKETAQRPYPMDIKATDRGALKEYANGCNVLHLHGDMNLNDPLAQWVFQQLPGYGVVVQQYYRERATLEPAMRRAKPVSREYEVITAKKGALLDPKLPRVPMVVPHWQEALQPVIRRRARLRLVFTPTSAERMLSYQGTQGKGYQETKPILDRLGKFLDVKIISNLNRVETLTEVREADIRLDEVVTGGFGMATLEGLACGCIVIGGMTPDVRVLLGEGSPVLSTNLKDLEALVLKVVSMPAGHRHEIQQAGADWVRSVYSEDRVFRAYNDVYGAAVEKYGKGIETLNQKPAEKQVEAVPQKIYNVTIVGTVTRDDESPPPPPAEVKAPTKGGKLIVQVATTNCAGAIWRIHEAINRYTPHTCRTITASDMTNGRRFPRDVLLGNRPAVADLLRRADVVHFHNWIDHESPEMRQYAGLIAGKTKVLQYHTEPAFVQRVFRRDVIDRNDIKTLVIAQKHVRFYPKSTIVPNLVDINDPALTPTSERWGGPLRVIYTPSDLKSYPSYEKTCCGKGYEATVKVLQRLEAAGLIKATIITSMNWEELMPLKRQHDVCIDECVTGGYHLCSLESLAQGLVTIAWIDEQTEAAIARITGKRTELPWVNTRMNDLEATLRSLAADPSRVEEIKKKSRQWMEENWNPATIIKHFISAYGIKESKVTKTARAFHQWGDNALSATYAAEPRLTDVLPLEDAWRDRQVVIWGNGFTVDEALAQQGDKWFQDAKHVGTNMAALLGVRFDAYCIGDLRFVEKPEKMKVAKEAPGCKVYAAFLSRVLPPELNANYVKVVGHNGISADMRKGIFHGYSVAWIGLQVALWAGARDILLAGCPHDYKTDQPRFYREAQASPVDQNLHKILNNYRTVLPILKSMGVRLRTIGKSRLQEAGVEQQLTLRVSA